MTKKYLLKGLDCAGCASKIEKKIIKLKGVKNANLNFMFQKLTVEFDDMLIDEIDACIKKIVNSYEPEVEVSQC